VSWWSRHRKRCSWPQASEALQLAPHTQTPHPKCKPLSPYACIRHWQPGGRKIQLSSRGIHAPPLTQTFHCACVMKLALKVYARLEVIPMKLPVMKNLIEIFTHTFIVSELSQAQVDR